ncbi:helix-turn-helix domain-containing protein [Actinomadura rugatobispora]|uniref:Multiprotein-bridging factor 1 family protein n=1 Tax=Actinomadura rugatobispora TaxID=1994 RepID=A0ABW1A060_9ACTN|nr:hypothetical protein GCM10010200_029080 [Actinomadura rugatobispora]
MTADALPDMMPPGAVAGPSRARACVRRPASVRPVAYLPDPDERERLAATLGETLRRLRAEAGLGTRALAVRAATTRSTVVRLERGERRPRRSMLSSLAMGLDPDRHVELLEVLAAAAGPSLRPESDGSARFRRRQIEAGILAGRVPLPSNIARPLALHRQADAASRKAERILARPGALDDAEALAVVNELMDVARRLREQAGRPFTLYLGKHRIRVGYRW